MRYAASAISTTERKPALLGPSFFQFGAMWAAVRVTTARPEAGASGLQAEILKMNKISMFGMHLRDNVGLSEAIIMLHMQRDRCAIQ
jgi:hypothetical protein